MRLNNINVQSSYLNQPRSAQKQSASNAETVQERQGLSLDTLPPIGDRFLRFLKEAAVFPHKGGINEVCGGKIRFEFSNLNQPSLISN